MDTHAYSQASIVEVAFGSEWKDRVEVRQCSRSSVDACIRRHYLHGWPAVNVAIFGAFADGITVGACVFSLPPRETAIRLGGVTWELSRLWLVDEMPRNAESWFIAKCIKAIRSSRPEVAFLVSYADPSAGHVGTIYRASNWRFDGMTDAERKTPRFDYLWNGKRYARKGHIPKDATGVERIPRVSKYRYVYAMQRRKRSA